ncbi:MAG: prepilin-type N-terminal cleavage/methylation domain-containing protein [bacterium]
MRQSRGFTLLELLVVASIIAIIAAIAIPQLLNARRSAWENRCKLTIRALASSQLAYADSNLRKDYGSFQNLQDTDYVQKGYTRTNMIDNYSMAVFYASRSSGTTYTGADSTFTIIAIPRSQKNRLRTFAICDDQTPRVATDYSLGLIANVDNTVPTGTSPCSWEPLR